MADTDDWTHTTADVSGAMAMHDLPDFTIGVDGGGAGYASLTGAGQTATPGDLTQEGNLFIDGGLSAFDTSAVGGVGVLLHSQNNTVELDSGNQGIGGDAIQLIGRGVGFGTHIIDLSALGMWLDQQTSAPILVTNSGELRVRVNGGIHIDNTLGPTTPSSGGILWVQAGALKYVGSSGTVTTIAPA